LGYTVDDRRVQDNLPVFLFPAPWRVFSHRTNSLWIRQEFSGSPSSGLTNAGCSDQYFTGFSAAR
jgi:hypothetical protein